MSEVIEYTGQLARVSVTVSRARRKFGNGEEMSVTVTAQEPLGDVPAAERNEYLTAMMNDLQAEAQSFMDENAPTPYTDAELAAAEKGGKSGSPRRGSAPTPTAAAGVAAPAANRGPRQVRRGGTGGPNTGNRAEKVEAVVSGLFRNLADAQNIAWEIASQVGEDGKAYPVIKVDRYTNAPATYLAFPDHFREGKSDRGPLVSHIALKRVDQKTGKVSDIAVWPEDRFNTPFHADALDFFYGPLPDDDIYRGIDEAPDPF